MAYPWPGFGSFLFTRDETAIFGTDRGWLRRPQYSRKTPLGSAVDSIVTMALGSYERRFEVYLSPTRYAALEALVNTSSTFVDWERPTPTSRAAFLEYIDQLEWVAVLCSDGSSEKRIRTEVSLISQ